MEKKYNIIYADPPWRYDMNRGQGAAENHYPTMSIQEICRLPVAELAAKDCALFLWVTFPQLQDAMKLFEAWGFTYKTLGFAWVKQIKGHPKRISKSISQLIISPLEQHSKKPDEVRKRIVELFGELPRIELFARQKTSGWDVWGNEVEGSASSRILENAGKGDGNRGICISTQRFDKGKK